MAQIYIEGVETPIAVVPKEIMNKLYNDTTGKGAISVTFRSEEEKTIKVTAAIYSRGVMLWDANTLELTVTAAEA